MPYTTYQFYENTYKGTNLDMEAFEKLVLRASYELNAICLGKINSQTLSMYSEPIQMATCSLIEQIYNDEQSKIDGKEIASESVESWHRTYVNSSNSNNSTQSKYADGVYQYLITTGLLYRGM